MQDRIRRLAVGLATAGLVLSLANPTFAEGRLAELGDEPSAVPMIFDVAVMRPLGLTAVVVGAIFYVVPVAPIMAITRPADIGKPLGPLVGTPVRFTFKDPIGHHPQP
jgi:hypothetical protein